MRIPLLICALVLCLLAWDFTADRYQSEAASAALGSFDKRLAADPLAKPRPGKDFSNTPFRVGGEMAPIIKNGIAEKSPCNSRHDA